MNSPVIRLFLIVFGWPLILFLMIISYEWIRDVYFIPPIGIPNTDPVRYPVQHKFGTKALLRFYKLPQSKQNLLIENLKSNIIPMEQWLNDLQKSGYEILVFGENHEEATRQFLATEFFSKFKIDALFLEATPEELERIWTYIEVGETRVPMLDAEISNIIRAVRVKSPTADIEGIEETEEQRKLRLRDLVGSRDKTIATNFWNRFKPGNLHAILFGALHCTNQPEFLYKDMLKTAPLSIAEKTLNIRVIGEHQSGPLESFVFFIDEIGVERENFVVPDTKSLHPLIHEWFLQLAQETLRKFHTLVVYRTNPQAIALLEKRINDNPTDAEAHYKLGVCYIHNGNYRGAEEMFDIAVHLAPNYGYMIGQEYIKAGTGLLDEGKTEPATQLFNKAVKYQPNLKENKKIHQ